MPYEYYFWQPANNKDSGNLIAVAATTPSEAKLKLARKWTGDSHIDSKEAAELIANWGVVGPILPTEIR